MVKGGKNVAPYVTRKGHNGIKYKLIKDMTWQLSWGKYNSKCIVLKASLYPRMNQ